MRREAKWLHGTEHRQTTLPFHAFWALRQSLKRFEVVDDVTGNMASKSNPTPAKKQDPRGKTQASNPPDDVAKLIRLTLAAEMEALQEKVAHKLEESLEKALVLIQKQMVENGDILRSLKEQADTHAKKFNTVFNKIDSIQTNLHKNEKDTKTCLTEMTQLRKKLNDLEDRSRRNNVRLVNLPTGAEGDDPRGYLQKMLPKWIPTLGSTQGGRVEIDRAHRIFSNNSNNTSRPRTMIFRLLRYTDRQAVLEGARKANPTLPDGTRLQFFADYSSGTTQERQEYKNIRAKLRQRGIDSFLLYPVILRVNIKGRRMSFNSAAEATEALKAEVTGDMEGDYGSN